MVEKCPHFLRFFKDILVLHLLLVRYRVNLPFSSGHMFSPKNKDIIPFENEAKVRCVIFNMKTR